MCRTPAEQTTKRRRVPKDATARFKPDDAPALAAAEAWVPEDHLARQVRTLLEGADVSQVEAQYSALGRRGYAPRQLLGVWVYASLIGFASRDEACAPVADRRGAEAVIGRACHQPAGAQPFPSAPGGLVPAGTGADGALRAEARVGEGAGVGGGFGAAEGPWGRAPGALRKRRRTGSRNWLRWTPAPSRSRSARAPTKVDKHTQAVARCTQAQAASVVLTSKAAALMQFPGNVYLPGHRLTVTASGTRERFVVAAHLNAAPNDTGQLGPALLTGAAGAGPSGTAVRWCACTPPRTRATSARWTWPLRRRTAVGWTCWWSTRKTAAT